MFIPDGYSESELIKIIDGVLDNLCHTFSFGYYDSDDMRQEGFIMAMEALPKYSTEFNTTLATFLTGHIKKRFINLKRNKLYRVEPPCSTCQYYSKKHKFCEKYNEHSLCRKWVAWSERNEAKRNLAEGCDSTNSVSDDEHDHDYVNTLYAGELRTYIDKKMPMRLMSKYRQHLDGVTIAKKDRDEVICEIKRIANLFDSEIGPDNG